MKAINEFQGPYHVSVHIPDENGEPLCNAPREEGNDLYGPHECGIVPNHDDVCADCRESVPREELHNSRYAHTDTERVIR